MSAWDGQTETVDIEAEVERRVNERLAGKLAEHGIKERPPEEQIQAEIIAAGSTEEIRAVLRKYDMESD